MANTSLTYSPADHTTTAGFRVWGSEFHAQLVAVGLTLTSDTGQINWTTITIPAINTSAGYEIWRFNDTLQATTPVFLKIEFGTAGVATQPAVWITVGNGSNGSGTLTGLTSSRSACTYAATSQSTTTNYFSRFVYNPTLGFFGFAWKIGLIAAYNGPYSAGFVFRSCDTTGAPTSTTVQLLTQTNLATVVGSTYGVMQCLNYTTSLIYPPTLPLQGQWWSTHIFGYTSTFGGASGYIMVDPVFYLTPTLGITQCLGRALATEIPVNVVAPATLVGSTPHNYVQIGSPFGAYTGQGSLPTNVTGLLMLWE